MLAVLASLIFFAQSPQTEPTDAAVSAPGDLPDALPPIDDALLETPSTLAAFAQGRLRFGLEQGRLFVPQDAVGATMLTGRMGVRGTIGDADATVVIGEGATLLMAAPAVGSPLDASFGPLLVVRPFAPMVHVLFVDVPTAAIGVPARFQIGRMPVVVADGRFVGAEAFDVRGRFLDGARLAGGTDDLTVEVGAFWLGPLAPGDAAAASGLLLLSLHSEPLDGFVVDAYLLGHRDGTPVRGGADPLLVPTAGGRARWAHSWLKARAGGDLQASFDEANGLALRGVAWHAEGAARFLPPSWIDAPVPFAELGVEATGGDDVLGAVFRAPAPTQHGTLGLLDLVAADNTVSPWLALGAAEAGFVAEVVVRNVSMLRPTGRLWAPDRRTILLPDRSRTSTGFFELDTHVALPVSAAASLDITFSLAAPQGAWAGEDAVTAHRLLCSLRFLIDDTLLQPGAPQRGSPQIVAPLSP